MDIETLVQDFKDAEKGFSKADEAIDDIVKNAGEFLGFRYEDCGDGKALVGFGHSLLFRWRFVEHEGRGYGKFGAFSVGSCPGPCDIQDNGDFYEIYFRRDIPVFQKSLNQKTGDFYGNQTAHMERLFGEIVEAFLKQSCFRP